MFTNLVKTGFKVKGRNKEYTWLPPTLRKYGEFVRWTQYKPYHDAVQNNLPKNIVQEILVKCRSGKVKEKTVPDDWPENDDGKYLKEPTEKDLIEKEVNIHLGSSCVVEHFMSAEGLAKLLQLGISINHPEVTEEILDQEVSFEEQNEAIIELQNAMFQQQEEIEKNEESPNQEK